LAQSIEQRFRFDASRGVDLRDVANHNKEVADQPRKLEQSLFSGASALPQIKNQILAQRKILEGRVAEPRSMKVETLKYLQTSGSAWSC
jgi:hypothetical protein